MDESSIGTVMGGGCMQDWVGSHGNADGLSSHALHWFSSKTIQ